MNRSLNTSNVLLVWPRSGAGHSQLRKWIRQYEAEIPGTTPAGVVLISEQRRIQEWEKQARYLEIENKACRKNTAAISFGEQGQHQRDPESSPFAYRACT